MNKLKIFVIAMLGISISLGSCAKKEVGGPEDVDSKASLCLKEMGYDFKRILSKEDIVKHVAIDESSFEVDDLASNDRYGYVSYSWKSDRPDIIREISGMKFSIPDLNTVSLKFLHFYSKDDVEIYSQESIFSLFDTGYKKLSDEEVRKMKANLEKSYENDPEGLKQALGFLETRLKMDFTLVDNVGDRAYWRWHEQNNNLELILLSGTATFSVHVKVKGVPADNLPYAIAIANEILNKCG